MTIGDNPHVGKAFTFNKNGFRTASYLEDSISRGQVFQLQKRIVIPAGVGAEYYLVIDSSPLIAAEKRLFIMPLSMKTTSGLVYCDTYAIESYNGGTLVPFSKVNAISPNVALSVAYKGVAVVGTPGDELREYTVGTKSTNQSSGANTPTIDIAKNFPAGTIMTAKFINQETFAVTVEFGMLIAEA